MFLIHDVDKILYILATFQFGRSLKWSSFDVSLDYHNRIYYHHDEEKFHYRRAFSHECDPFRTAYSVFSRIAFINLGVVDLLLSLSAVFIRGPGYVDPIHIWGADVVKTG